MADRTTNRFSRLQIWLASAAYGVIIVGALAISAVSLAQLSDVYALASSSAETLSRLEGRVPPPPATAMPELWPPDAPRGSAFLEGDTMTVAGAALLQRVTSAVGRTGGYVVSSQIELQSSTSGRIGLVITGEMNPAALQGFLYDIEGGMPFLFVDQLLVQAPGGSEGTEGGNARMTITLSGQWRRER